MIPHRPSEVTALEEAAQMLDADRADAALDVLRRANSPLLVHDYASVFAIGLVTSNDGATDAARLIEAALGSPSRLNAALLRLLLRAADRHHWAFANAVDWRVVLVDDAIIDDLAVSLWHFDPTTAAIMYVAAISAAPGRARRLPPKSLRSFKTIGTWQAACRASEARGRLLLSELLDLLEKGASLLTLHRPLSPAEIYEMDVFLSAAQPYFPELCAWYSSCLARKLNEDGQSTRSLGRYYAALREDDVQHAPLDFIFNSAANSVRTALAWPALEWSDHRLLDVAELKTLILLCISTMQKVEGVLLSECLRMISPADAIFAAWACLCLDAPEWSDAGFRHLTYVNPATIAGFPKLIDWPARRPPQAAYDHFLRRTTEWPRITIVVPSFQQGEFIEETIQSIVHQGYPNVEIIVEDGGSTDATLAVLERYRAHIAHLRSSRDDGQSDAIMQGFGKASGTILGWLNSDDMLAPFALFHVAEAVMRGADLVAGACFEFKGPRFVQANLAANPSGTIKREALGDLRDKWFMGHFFYQPEVFFTAELYARAGGLIDRSLHYTMDYDLWMRFSQQEPRFSKVFWPVALFRRHEEQKTFNLDRTVIEQGITRRRYVAVEDDLHQLRIRSKVRTLSAKPVIKAHVITGKVGIFFPDSTAADLAEAFQGSRYQVDFSQADASLVADDCDIVVHVNTLTESERVFMEVVQGHPGDPLKVGWFWDNHHAFMPNLNFARRYDIGIAGHDFARDYLANAQMLLLPSVPLCFTQWSASTLASARDVIRESGRGNGLQGGFVDYPDVPARGFAIRRLVESGLFDELELIDIAKPGGYFSRTTRERLATWCSRKVSLAANVDRDIPIRFFDALVLGQIPIIPKQTLDLPWFSDRFPDEKYVVCDSLEPAEVERAWRQALAIFDREGSEGLRARTDKAAARHCFATRLTELLATIEAAADEQDCRR